MNNNYKPEVKAVKYSYKAGFSRRFLYGAMSFGVMGLSLSALAQQPVASIDLMTTTESYDPIRYEAAFIIAERWRELGFEVNVQPTEFSTALERLYDQQDFDAVILGWSGRTDASIHSSSSVPSTHVSRTWGAITPVAIPIPSLMRCSTSSPRLSTWTSASASFRRCRSSTSLTCRWSCSSIATRWWPSTMMPLRGSTRWPVRGSTANGDPWKRAR